MNNNGAPGRWPLVRLGELAEFRNGVNYNKANFGRGIKVINVADFQDRMVPDLDGLQEIDPTGVVRADHLLQPNDILFVRSNGNRLLIGRSMFVPDDAGRITHSAFTIRLRFTATEVEPRFFAYLFRSDAIRDVLSSQGGGTNISNLNQDILASMSVPLPALQEQQRIASVLSAYDDLIENNTRRIAILEEVARALYREWFVDFRFPGHQRVRMVIRGNATVPEGWDVKTLGDECEVVMGQSPKSKFYNLLGNGLPFHQGVSDYGPHIPTHRVHCSVTDRLAQRDDILVSVRAPVGRLNVADRKLVIGRGLAALHHKEGFQTFTLFQLKEVFREEDSMGGGTIFKAITKKDLHGVKFLRPREDLMQRFEMAVSNQWRLLMTLTGKNRNLRTTRDLLLPRLVSGELSVADMV